jgi:integrase
MKKPVFKITRRSLDAIRPEKDGSVRGNTRTDATLKGFYVGIFSSGTITYGVRYGVAGQRRMVKIGEFPAMTPETARTEAMRILSAAALGQDEAEKRQAAREAAEGKAARITFATWRSDYLKDVARRRLKSSSEIERYLELTGETWDSRPLADLTTRDVQVFRDRIADSGKTTSANRWHTTIAASFAAAVRAGHIERNPFVNVRKLKENDPRSRVLTADEEKGFREALTTWPNAWEKTAFVLLLDTGARVGEVLAAKWEDFTLDAKGAGIWRLPKPKSGHPQVVPILPGVGTVVAATPKVTDCDFLIPGRNGLVRRHDLRKAWAALKTKAKLGADVHVHDIRRSFGLRAALAVGVYGASKLLRHSSSAVTERIYAPLTAVHLKDFATNTEAARVKVKAKAEAPVLTFKRRKKTA